MRKSAVYLAMLLLCQAQTLGTACFAGDNIEKDLDKLLGTPAADTNSDSSAGPAVAPDSSGAQQQKEKSKPPKEKKSKEKKEKPQPSASNGGADAAPVDMNKLNKSLDKLLGPSSTESTSPTVPSADSTPPVPSAGTTVSPDSGSAAAPPADSTATAPPSSSDDSSATMPSTGQSNSSGNGTDTISDIGEYAHLTDAQIKAGELNNEAVTALNAKQFQKAIDLLKQALAIAPGYTTGKGNLRVAYYNAAVELYNDGKYTEALPYIEKSIQIMKELHRDDADAKSLYEDCKKAIAETQKK